uniref:Uncharacterized protein n=1 Tax=Seriola lalandi dorsalis TaxID=1841481 RepID=A0A3B4YF44_SERLL
QDQQTVVDPGEKSGPQIHASIPSPQSEAVANELRELSLQPAPSPLPLTDRRGGKLLFFFSPQEQEIEFVRSKYGDTKMAQAPHLIGGWGGVLPLYLQRL